MGFDAVKNHYIDLINVEKKKYENPNMQLSDNKMVIVESFYNIKLDDSSVSKGFESITNYIGEDASVRYNKINDVVMFGFKPGERSLSDDDKAGFVYDQGEGTSLIMADTFEPISGSFFKVLLDDGYFLYHVTKVEEVLDKDRSMYRITHEKYVDNSETRYKEIEDNVVEEFMYIKENVGIPDKKVVVSMTKYNEFADMYNCIKSLQFKYLKAFYKKRYHTLCCEVLKDDGKSWFYHSPYIIEFIKNTDCLYDEKSSVNLYFEHEVIIDRAFELSYNNSIYKKVEDGSCEFGVEDTIFTIDFYDNSDIFSFMTRVNTGTILIIDRDEKNVKIYRTLPDISKFKDVMIDLNVSKDKIPSTYDTLDKAFKCMDNIDEFRKLFDGYDVDSTSLRDYMMIPIVIYILKVQGLKKVVNKTYQDNILNLLGL